MEEGATVGKYREGKTKVRGEGPVPLPLFTTVLAGDWSGVIDGHVLRTRSSSCNRQRRPRGGEEVLLYSLFNFGGRCGWVVNATPRSIYPLERPGTHCIGGWVGPRAGLDGSGKSRLPPGFDPLTVQPIASRYTDWAILAHIETPNSPYSLTSR